MQRFPLPEGSYWWSSAYRPPHRPNHYGVDLAAPEGTPLHAVIDGRIFVPAFERNGAGHNIWLIAHNGLVLYKYFHMSAIHVRTGQDVSAGDVVGLVGNTGASFGAHLHIERHRGSGGSSPTDPTAELRAVENDGVGVSPEQQTEEEELMSIKDELIEADRIHRDELALLVRAETAGLVNHLNAAVDNAVARLSTELTRENTRLRDEELADLKPFIATELAKALGQ